MAAATTSGTQQSMNSPLKLSSNRDDAAPSGSGGEAANNRTAAKSELLEISKNHDHDSSSIFGNNNNDHNEFIRPDECPIFRPSNDEFQNPIQYINKIRPMAEKFGIAKIQPPKTWNPSFAIDVDQFKFTPHVQCLNELEMKTRLKLNFLNRIAKYWESNGSQLKIPMIERQLLDLYALHQLVQEEGGLEQTTRDRKWSKIAQKMFHSNVKNIGMTLKGHYERILYPFDVHMLGKTELLIDEDGVKIKTTASNSSGEQIASNSSDDQSEFELSSKPTTAATTTISSSLSSEATILGGSSSIINDITTSTVPDIGTSSSDSVDDDRKINVTSAATFQFIAPKPLPLLPPPPPPPSPLYHSSRLRSALSRRSRLSSICDDFNSTNDSPNKLSGTIKVTTETTRMTTKPTTFNRRNRLLSICGDFSDINSTQSNNSSTKSTQIAKEITGTTTKVTKATVTATEAKTKIPKRTTLRTTITKTRRTTRKPHDRLSRYICPICNRGDREESMLLCDSCDDSYHTFCLMPPLNGIPKGEWHCPHCINDEIDKTNDTKFVTPSSAQQQREYTLRQFGEMADQFKSNYFRRPIHLVPIDLVEREFWRLLSAINEDVTIEYATNLNANDYCSGFPTKYNSKMSLIKNQDQQYIESKWNFNNLPLLNESILRFLNSNSKTMSSSSKTMTSSNWNDNELSVSSIDIGMCFSAFCWHIKNHWLYSINYLHWGEPKTWYCVPAYQADLFEQTIKQYAPTLFNSQPNLLHEFLTIINPNILMKNNLTIYRIDQLSGEFIITFPRSYHSGFNHGYNFSETINFATSDWLKFGRNCINHYSFIQKPNHFSHDELICKMSIESMNKLDYSIAIELYIDMIQMIDNEKLMRANLFEWGLINLECETFELISFDDRKCFLCNTICFLSAVKCLCRKNIISCLRHYTKLCTKCLPQQHLLQYRYTLTEMTTMIRKLKLKVVHYEKWLIKCRNVINPSLIMTNGVEMGKGKVTETATTGEIRKEKTIAIETETITEIGNETETIEIGKEEANLISATETIIEIQTEEIDTKTEMETETKETIGEAMEAECATEIGTENETTKIETGTKEAIEMEMEIEKETIEIETETKETIEIEAETKLETGIETVNETCEIEAEETGGIETVNETFEIEAEETRGIETVNETIDIGTEVTSETGTEKQTKTGIEMDENTCETEIEIETKETTAITTTMAIKKPNQRKKITFESLQELYKEGIVNKYPNPSLLDQLHSSIVDAEKCQTIIQQLDMNKIRTRTRNSIELKKYKLTIDDFELFVNEINSLSCTIKDGNSVCELLKLCKQFITTSNKILKLKLNSSNLDEKLLENLINDSQSWSLCIELPQLQLLRQRHDQLIWYNRIRRYRKSNIKLQLTELKKLIKDGMNLLPNLIIESELSKLYNIVCVIECWENEVKTFLNQPQNNQQQQQQQQENQNHHQQSCNEKQLNDIELLLNAADYIQGEVPSKLLLKEAFKKAKEWLQSIDALQLNQSYPYYRTLENIVQRGKSLPFKMNKLESLIYQLDICNDWKEKAAKVFLGKHYQQNQQQQQQLQQQQPKSSTSSTSSSKLLEILSPRRIDGLLIMIKRKEQQSQQQSQQQFHQQLQQLQQFHINSYKLEEQFNETLSPAQMVDTFKKAEEKEIRDMKELRKLNFNKNPIYDKYCHCNGKFYGKMYLCQLCLDWYHASCVKFNQYEVLTKIDDNKLQQQQQQPTISPFDCNNESEAPAPPPLPPPPPAAPLASPSSSISSMLTPSSSSFLRLSLSSTSSSSSVLSFASTLLSSSSSAASSASSSSASSSSSSAITTLSSAPSTTAAVIALVQQQQPIFIVPQFPNSRDKDRELKYLCSNCLRSRRPRLETILSLLVSLQRLPLRLPEGEALQCLTERAMNWQDRCRQLFANDEMTTILSTLSMLAQKNNSMAMSVETMSPLLQRSPSATPTATATASTVVTTKTTIETTIQQYQTISNTPPQPSSSSSSSRMGAPIISSSSSSSSKPAAQQMKEKQLKRLPPRYANVSGNDFDKKNEENLDDDDDDAAANTINTSLTIDDDDDYDDGFYPNRVGQTTMTLSKKDVDSDSLFIDNRPKNSNDNDQDKGERDDDDDNDDDDDDDDDDDEDYCRLRIDEDAIDDSNAEETTSSTTTQLEKNSHLSALAVSTSAATKIEHAYSAIDTTNSSDTLTAGIQKMSTNYPQSVSKKFLPSTTTATTSSSLSFDGPLIELKRSTKETLENLMMEGDLLEVSLDETTYLWRILNAAKPSISDLEKIQYEYNIPAHFIEPKPQKTDNKSTSITSTSSTSATTTTATTTISTHLTTSTTSTISTTTTSTASSTSAVATSHLSPTSETVTMASRPSGSGGGGASLGATKRSAGSSISKEMPLPAKRSFNKQRKDKEIVKLSLSPSPSGKKKFEKKKISKKIYDDNLTTTGSSNSSIIDVAIGKDSKKMQNMSAGDAAPGDVASTSASAGNTTTKYTQGSTVTTSTSSRKRKRATKVTTKLPVNSTQSATAIGTVTAAAAVATVSTTTTTSSSRQLLSSSASTSAAAAAATVVTSNSDDDEECSATNCYKPSSREVDWVQCDGGCNEWFHMFCVGLDRKQIKLDDDYICKRCMRSTISSKKSQNQTGKKNQNVRMATGNRRADSGRR